MSKLQRALILGSTSRYRRELLERLRVPFDVVSPDVDETPLAGEAPRAALKLLAAGLHHGGEEFAVFAEPAFSAASATRNKIDRLVTLFDQALHPLLSANWQPTPL